MRVVVFISLLLGFFPACAQTGYADFVVNGSNAWLLTRAGGLEQANLRTMQSAVIAPPPAPRLTAIAKDTTSTLVAVDSAGQVWRLDKQARQWSKLTICPYPGVYGLVVDHANRYLFITRRGIWVPGNSQCVFPADSLFLNNQTQTRSVWPQRPSAYQITQTNQLWIGFAYGEWGGDLFVFDADSSRFLRLQPGNFRLNVSPITSIVAGRTGTFVTTGLAHFITHGAVAAFIGLSATILLDSKPYWKPIGGGNSRLQRGEYIGPAAFNPHTSCLYFYSQNGIFQGNVSRDLSTIGKWTRVAQPNLSWTAGQRDAVGPAMNVQKMAFTDSGHLLFLTEHEGLGLFDGKTIRFIKLEK